MCQAMPQAPWILNSYVTREPIKVYPNISVLMWKTFPAGSASSQLYLEKMPLVNSCIFKWTLYSIGLVLQIFLLEVVGSVLNYLFIILWFTVLNILHLIQEQLGYECEPKLFCENLYILLWFTVLNILHLIQELLGYECEPKLLLWKFIYLR